MDQGLKVVTKSYIKTLHYSIQFEKVRVVPLMIITFRVCFEAKDRIHQIFQVNGE